MARTAKTLSKAGPTTAVDVQSATYPVHLLKSLCLVVTLASASLATQLALHPLYGSKIPSLNHSKVELLACLLSAFFSHDPTRVSERTTLLGLATWLGYAPYASYAIGKWSSKWKNPVLGSSAAEAAILLPAVCIGVILLRQWSSRFFRFLPGPMTLKAIGAFGSFNCLNLFEQWLWTHLPLGGQVQSTNILIAIAGILTLAAGFSPPPSQISLSSANSGVSFTRSYKTLLPFFLPIIAILVSLSAPPNSSPQPPYTRSTTSSRSSRTFALPATPAMVRILASAHSTTGIIQVGEHLEQGFRFLRVDHSLIGGRWVGDKVAPGSRDGLGDSIYSNFVLQEAIRLVERNNAKDESALFLGLGAGIAAEAFITNRINTTVVEMDSAVYDYARKYFSLPEPNQVYIQDAREWVYDHAPLAAEDKYDYIVHDCFSGGGVSGRLYTLEFWEKLKSMVKSNGIVAVNFAGKLASEPARAVYLTLQRSFGQCRGFHDHLEAEFDNTYAFYNVVFFCMPLTSTPLKFRAATKADYLRSHLRRHVLGAFAAREVQPNQILGLDQEPDLLGEGEERWILRDGANHLEEWQLPDVIDHWTVMREVLPDMFWETY